MSFLVTDFQIFQEFAMSYSGELPMEPFVEMRCALEEGQGIPLSIVSKVTRGAIGWSRYNLYRDWKKLHKWLESVVGHMEELAEGIHDVVKNINVSTRKELDITIDLLENAINRSRECPMDMAETTVFIFYLLFGLHNLDRAEMTSSLNSLKDVN